MIVVGGAQKKKKKKRDTSPALVEGVYLDAVVCVLLQDLLGVLIRVEGVHKDQWHVCVIRFVQVLQMKKKKFKKRKRRKKKVLVAVRLLRKRPDSRMRFQLSVQITFWYILITSDAKLVRLFY